MSRQTLVSNFRISIVLILRQGNVAPPLIHLVLCHPFPRRFLSWYGPWNWTLVSYFTIVPPSHLSGWSCSALLPILAACPPLCCRRCPRHPDDSLSAPIQIFPASPMLPRHSPRSSAIVSFVIVLHLPEVSLLATCSVVTCPFSSLRFLLLHACTFTNKLNFPMGIFALYIMFTTYAAPLVAQWIGWGRNGVTRAKDRKESQWWEQHWDMY